MISEDVKGNSINSEIYFSQIMDRIKKLAEVKRDGELAELLGLGVTAFSNRKKSGSVPYENVIEVSSKSGWDIGWIFTGQRTETIGRNENGLKNDEGTNTSLRSPLDHLRLLEIVVRSVERNRPSMAPENKAKLITLLCEWARAKYEEAEESESLEDFELDDKNVIRFADVIGQK